MAEGTQTIAITVPLLFLLITQFSSIARDMELAEVVAEEHSPLVFPMFDKVSIPMYGKVDFFPAFGRFNFLHGINSVIVGLVFFLAVNLLSGTLSWVILAIVLLVWLVLPALEVEEYDQRLNADSVSGLVNGSHSDIPDWWHSLHTHGLCVLVTAPLLYLTILILQPGEQVHSRQAVEAGIVLASSVSAVITYLLPLHDLRRELEEVNTETDSTND